MRAALLWFLRAMLAGLLLALVAGFAGRWHPVGDSFAAFRLQFAGAAGAVALVLALLGPRHGRWPLTALAAAVAIGVPAASGYAAFMSVLPPGHGLVLYQKNLNFRTGDLDRIAADIRAQGVDIVTLQEVSRRNRALLQLLAPDYPQQAYCPYLGVGGTAVLSRLKAAGHEPVCATGGGMTALKLEGPRGPLWAVSIHLHWPWPHAQAAQAARLQPVLAALDAPVVLGGDFNMVPWGESTRLVARAARAELAGPVVATFDLTRGRLGQVLGGLMSLPIDQVMMPPDWVGERFVRPELGSDHRGLVLRAVAP